PGWFSNLGLAAARRQPGYPGWVLASRPATPGREAGLGRETGSVRTKNGLGRCGPAVDDRDLRPTAPFVQEGPMKIDNSPARGMRDLLPADVAVRDHVLESISAVYRQYGYQRIETPALEHIERLQGGEGGDNEKLIFEVLRRGLPPEVAAGTPLRELAELGLRS